MIMKNTINDGIIDEETFKKESVKILFVLKEAYDKNIGGDFTKEGGWSLPELINKMIKDFTLTQIPTFNGLFLFSAQYFQSDSLEVIKKIAYINIIKKSGISKTNSKELKSTFNENKKILLTQIHEIKPNVIIFAGNAIGNLFMKEWGLNKECKKRDSEDSSHYFHYRDFLCITTYHPSHERRAKQSFSKVCIPEIIKTINKNLKKEI